MGSRWCRDNDEKCQQIAKNAQELYRTYVSREGILDYMQVGTVVLENTGDGNIALRKAVIVIVDISTC